MCFASIITACDDGATGNKPGDTDGDSDIQVEGDAGDIVNVDGDDVDTAEILENHDQVHIDGDDADDLDNADPVDDPACLPEIDAPEVVDFGVVQMGHSATRDIVIRNTGCGDLLLFSVLLNGSSHGFGGEFMLLGIPANEEFPLTIAPGESFEFIASYSPVNAGEDEAVVSVQTNVAGKEVIEIRLISHAPPSRLCFRVLDGNPRDLDDGVLEMGEVEADETRSRTIRVWNCASEEIGGTVSINAMEIEQDYEMFAIDSSMSIMPWSLHAVGMNMPTGPCLDSWLCADITVSYNPWPWRDGMMHQDLGQVRVSYDSSAGENQVFGFSVLGEVTYSGLTMFPLEPGCNGVHFDSTHYLGYVIRNYTSRDFLINNAEIRTGYFALPSFQIHRGVDNVTLRSGEEYLLVVKYTPPSEEGVDERRDVIDLRVQYCDRSEDACVAGSKDFNSVYHTLELQPLDQTCLAQTEPDNGNWPPQAVINALCNMNTSIWANVPDGTENCGYEWSWLEKTAGSNPTIESTTLVNPEGYWDSVNVKTDMAGFYLLAEQKMNCNSGILQYIGLVAMDIDCRPNLKLNMHIEGCNGEGQVDMIFGGPENYECSQQVMETTEGLDTGVCIHEPTGLATAVMETSPQCSESTMITMTTAYIPDGEYYFCAELLNACDEMGNSGNCLENITPSVSINLHYDHEQSSGTFNEHLGTVETTLTTEHEPFCWSLPLNLGEWGEIAPIQ